MSGLRAWPLTFLAVASESALIVAGAGGTPAIVLRVFAVPAYGAHLALSLLLPRLGFWLYAAMVLLVALLIDAGIHRLRPSTDRSR